MSYNDEIDEDTRRLIWLYRPKGTHRNRWTERPCRLCGWARWTQIHRNAELRGKGRPYHEYEAREGATQ